MFKQLFASMNEALDDIIAQYPAADAGRREELHDKLSVLKAMSDICIEEWLLFEEKLGELMEQSRKTAAPAAEAEPAPCIPIPKEKEKDPAAPSFTKGQGFYKLEMFHEAVGEFERVVRHQPDFLLARMYLAMSYLRSGEYADAYRHFQLLVPLTDDRRMKAISYNAMGCIQAEHNNMDMAMEYFKKAYKADPDSVEPGLGLKHWPARS